MAPWWLVLALGLLLLPSAWGQTGPKPAPSAPPLIMALGDSLTAAPGLRPDQAWPALVQEKLRQQGLPHRLVNAGVSGDTSAGGLARLDWLLAQKPMLVVVELGGNDGLRGLEPRQTELNLEAIVLRCQAAGAQVVLAGVRLPKNYGPDYVAQFDALYPRLARRHRLVFIPFILEGVAGQRHLNLPDGLHPNGRGHQKMAALVWAALEPLLKGPNGRRTAPGPAAPTPAPSAP